MRLESVEECYLCGGKGERLYSNLQDRIFGAFGNWSFKKCGNCRIIWLEERPTEETILGVYQTYYTHSPNLSRLGRLRDRFQEGFFRSLLGKGKGSLLDIGCGEGKFLSLAQRSGWAVQGTEPDETSAQLARKRYGVAVLPELPGVGHKFDLVTMFHVLEHLHDPIRSLEEAYSLLHPGGRLVILTPNSESLGHCVFGRDWRGLEPPRHLFLFSFKSLETVVQKAGFQILSLKDSSRLATNFYAASGLLQTRGYYRREDISVGLLLRGGLFQLYETAIGIYQPSIGEELVLVGQK